MKKSGTGSLVLVTAASGISDTCGVPPLQVRKPHSVNPAPVAQVTCAGRLLFSKHINKSFFPIVGMPDLCTHNLNGESVVCRALKLDLCTVDYCASDP